MKNNESERRTKRNVLFISLVMIVAGGMSCLVCSSLSDLYWDLLGLLLAVSLAALMIGIVPGFLFGIPKLNKAYYSKEEDGRRTMYHPNTNLEEISDWLTKIIIGLTLIQLGKIPGYLQGMAEYILSGIGCAGVNCEIARPMVIGLSIYFGIVGFIIAYIVTRLYLSRLMILMEEHRVQEEEILLWREGMRRILRQAGQKEGTDSGERDRKDSGEKEENDFREKDGNDSGEKEEKGLRKKNGMDLRKKDGKNLQEKDVKEFRREEMRILMSSTLTDEEIHILRKIRNSEDGFMDRNVLTAQEEAVVRVLTVKGLVEANGENVSGSRVFLRITDEGLMVIDGRKSEDTLP